MSADAPASAAPLGRPVPPLQARPRTWVAAAALVIGNLFLHKPISDVCDALFAYVGRTPYEWISLAAIGALSLAGALALLRGVDWRAQLTARRGLGLLLLGLFAAAAQHWLLVSNVELIHFPQFGLLAALLLAAGLPPRAAWLAATAGGAIDEAYQRVVIYPSVPNVYFDWNDIVLNAIGAALAVVIAAPALRAAAPRRAVLAVAVIACLIALIAVPPSGTVSAAFPFWRPTVGLAMTGRYYHVMPASEGLIALLAIWLIVRWSTRDAAPDRAGTA